MIQGKLKRLGTRKPHSDANLLETTVKYILHRRLDGYMCPLVTRLQIDMYVRRHHGLHQPLAYKTRLQPVLSITPSALYLDEVSLVVICTIEYF